ncbi:MAG: hypothetical protein ACTMIR_02415 [Cellulomonadaceae bacterium]
MKTVPIRAFSVLACGALLLAGCANDSPTQVSAEDSPLNEFYQAIFGDGEEWTEERAAEDHRKVEELVSACMSEEGFDYTPVPYQDGTVFSSTDEEDGLEYGSVAYAEKYGYGITYWQDQTIEQQSEEQVEYVDPNSDYVESMSSGEQDAYYSALWGNVEYNEDDYDEDGMWIGEGEDPSMDWRTQGCYGSAQHEVYNDGSSANELYDDPAWVEIEEQMMSLYEQIQTDPKVTQAQSEWSSCMADAGFSYGTQEEAQSSLGDEVNAMWEEQYAGMEDIDWEDPEQVAAYEKASSATPEGWAEFREREYAVAVADAKCAESSELLTTTVAVQLELEQQFVDDHRAELDAIVDKYGTTEKK